MELTKLERRIIDISFKKGLSHIGSSLTALPLIKAVYDIKKPTDKFILDNSHASLALDVVLEDKGYGDAEELFDKQGVHADRIASRTYTEFSYTEPIDCSGGSLGLAFSCGVGMAIADRSKTVYILTSDGACAEGVIWESLRIAGEQKLENLKVIINANGFSAYDRVDIDLLEKRLNMFFPCEVVQTHFLSFPKYLQGLEAHYHVLTKEEYEEITKL